MSPKEALGIDQLYIRAQRLLNDQKYVQAAHQFDRIVKLDADGPLLEKALFYSGEAYDLGADPELAVVRYETFARRFGEHPLARSAWLRTLRLHAYQERWLRAGAAADVLLDRYAPLRPFESVVVFGGKALEQLKRGDIERALYFVSKGRSVAEAHGMDRAGRLPRDLAGLYFALGEARRVYASRIKFAPLPADFVAALEQRCQLLLDAQSAYSDTMRAHDAHWSAMAGFRVAELYHSLHRDLMRVQFPQAAAGDPRRQALFEGAMRLRYSVLLEKARGMLEHTVAMAERTGEQSKWVVRAREALSEIARAEDREQRALDGCGYTRAELRAALDQLADKAKASRHSKLEAVD